jgi:hypothetical protein
MANQDTPAAGFVLDANGKKLPVQFGAAAKAAEDGKEWQCSGCNEMMGPSAKAYCANCSEDDEPDGDEDEDEAKALGLDVKATAAARRERMVALVGFERQVLATVGETSAATAIGKVAAGALAIGQAELFRVAAEDQQKVTLQQQFATALSDKRLSLGHLTAVIPTFLSATPGKDKDGNPTPSERAKAYVAIAALPSQTRAGVVAALSTATITADTLENIKGFASVQTALPETPHTEPPLDAQNRVTVLKVSKEEAAKFGMKPESFEKFANITSVDQIERPTPKQGA